MKTLQDYMSDPLIQKAFEFGNQHADPEDRLSRPSDLAEAYLKMVETPSKFVLAMLLVGPAFGDLSNDEVAVRFGLEMAETAQEIENAIHESDEHTTLSPLVSDYFDALEKCTDHIVASLQETRDDISDTLKKVDTQNHSAILKRAVPPARHRYS